ncbi:MAG: hypothetical protein WC654_01565 [Patescibacteria group bacterium]
MIEQVVQGPHTDENVRRASRALHGQALGLRPHELCSFQVPDRIEQVVFNDERVVVALKDRLLDYDDGLLCPPVTFLAAEEGAEEISQIRPSFDSPDGRLIVQYDCLVDGKVERHLIWGDGSNIRLGYAYEAPDVCLFLGDIMMPYVRVVKVDHIVSRAKTTEMLVNMTDGTVEERVLLEGRNLVHAIPFPEGSVVVHVTISKDGVRLEQIGDGPMFADIPRETMRFVNGKLRYVGWLTYHVIQHKEMRLGPVLVHGDNVRPLAEPNAYGVNVLQDGDALAVLTLRATKVCEPEPESLFCPEGDDGLRRDTVVRFLDSDLEYVEQDSVPNNWTFMARVGDRVVLAGRRLKHEGGPTAAILASNFPWVTKKPLTGKVRRVQDGVLLETLALDGEPTFLWLHEDGIDEFPLYGELKNLTQTGNRTLSGWHTDGDRTLFLTRYDCD